MFEDIDRFKKPKVRLFFRYLANAASKQRDVERPLEKFPEESPGLDIEERMRELSDDRKEELETKIKFYFSKNEFLPFENRLKKIKRKYLRLTRARKHKYRKAKLRKLKSGITRCENILEELKKFQK